MNVHATKQQESTEEIVAALGTGPIPAAPYYCPDYFALEAEAVFRRSWLLLGHVCELAEPGSFIVRPIEVAKASILITRGRDGAIRAFHNVCAHRGTELVAEAEGKRSVFSCRYHMWTYDHDGRLVAAPDFERFDADKADCGLRPVAVDVCAGMIFVNLDPAPAQGLRDYLGSIADHLELLPVSKATGFSEYVYEVDANWKVLYDNFQENYHLKFVHPRSGASGGSGPDNPFGYPVAYAFEGKHRRQTIWTNPNMVPAPVQGFAFGKQAAAAAMDGLPSGPHNREYCAIFPNLFVFSSKLQPWSHVIMPIAADRSRGVFRFYWIGDDASASMRMGREYAVAGAREVHAEDTVMVEASQRGLNSGAVPHIHFQSEEVLCRHFFHAVDTMVQEYKAERAGSAA